MVGTSPYALLYCDICPRRDDEHHTYADYLTWSDAARYELIDGTAYEMAATPSRMHQNIFS